MADEGLQRTLAELTRDGRVWVELGQVVGVKTHSSYGYLLDIVLRPSGMEVQARPLWAVGAAQGEGIYWPVAVDDEVLVFCPGGDYNRAVALAGPTSSPAKPPTGWSNGHIELLHSGGVVVRASPGNGVEKVLKAETFDADAAAALGEVATLLQGLGLPTPNLTSFVTKLTAGTYRSSSLSAE